ncbi:hypothetical protein [Nocardioides sp.]|uniref:hypothetical protein n=1 Tax=Nocardioides sp. TaxID=35761 RepID=UPI00286D71A8|nr:hypothetical protein [Nocardioides sp.]
MTNTPITTQANLHQAWRGLIHPLGFSSRCLWLMFLDPDGMPVPQLTELTDLPDRPAPADVAALERFLGHFGGTGIRLAVFVGSRGSGLPGADDRAWADAIYLACGRASVACETVHLGTSTAITPLPCERPLDGLGATG